ncbi:uncharacterized protein LOC135340879 [Halichondria panicea]|uniref:uncharacterized protein LOC135340879 n=1 Tax=Halichondria panicea TaxID=6063 RepID=UPI00312B7FE9
MANLLFMLYSATSVLFLPLASSYQSPCDSLTPEYCALPFPSSYYTAPDPSTATGLKVNFSSATFPLDIIGRGVNPAEWNTLDGFSPFPSILTYFPHLSDFNLPPHWDIQQSLAEDSPTILIEADTGERIAHFAELDTAANLAERALMIWPSKRLKSGTRYIVALRYLEDESERPIQPSPGFIALRDKTTSKDPDIESRRQLFEEIFSTLSSIGITRNSLQLAWDFNTASIKCLTQRLLFMRDDGLARTSAKGSEYILTKVEDNLNENIFRKIQGYMSVPIYTDGDLPGAHLVLDPFTMLPVYQEQSSALFTLLIPHSVANSTHSPPLLLQYGHGLFGSQSEVESGYLEAEANEYGYILFACDWWGMSELDVPSIALMIGTDISHFSIIPDRLTQGMLNAHILMRLVKSTLSADPMVNLNGSVKIDTELTYYYGNSLGGILGDVYMASTVDVKKGVLGVAGGPFGLLLPRSKDFIPFEVSMRILYPDPVDFITALGFANMIWSRLEPSAYMASITADPLPNTPTHRVLFHYALGDAQVNVLALYSVARSAGAVMFESNVRCSFQNGSSGVITEKLYELPLVSDSAVITQDSVAVGFECGSPPEPLGNRPPDSKYDTHVRPRKSPLAQKQIDDFLRTGQVTNVCNGKCIC